MFGNKNTVHEFFSSSDAVTATASAPIKGKTFVKLVAGSKEQVPMIATAGAGDRVYGVAGWDVAKDESVTVFRTGILSVTAGASLTVPSAITVGANGKAVAANGTTDAVLGDLHQDVAADADAAVALTL